jgi:hypothetical protein
VSDFLIVMAWVVGYGFFGYVTGFASYLAESKRGGDDVIGPFLAGLVWPVAFWYPVGLWTLIRYETRQEAQKEQRLERERIDRIEKAKEARRLKEEEDLLRKEGFLQ